MRALKALAVASLIPFFTACGGVKIKNGGGDDKVGTQKVIPVDGDGLQFSDGVVSGTGSFKGPDTAYTARAKYALSFQLTGNSGVTLVSHGSANLNNGIELELTRDSSSNVLNAVFRSGEFAETKSFDFRDFDANDIVSLEIEINRGNGDYAGLRVSRLNANGTREVVTTGSLPTSASYPFWGVKMTNATVFESTRR